MLNRLNTSKKSMQMLFVIGIILAIFTLLVLFFFISNSMEDADYESAVLGCQMLLKNINGQAAFFSDSLDKPTLKLVDAVTKTCPSKSMSVSDKEVRGVANLIYNCWRQGGKGTDFLGASMVDVGIGIYCGRVDAKTDIENFNEKLFEILQEDKYKSLFEVDNPIVNLNKQILSKEALPKSISKDDSITIFYTITRPPLQSTTDNVINYISKKFGSLSSITSVVNYYSSSSSVDTYANLIISTPFKYSEGDFEDITSGVSDDNCLILVPIIENNFD